MVVMTENNHLPKEELLTIPEVAAYLRVNPATARAFILSGQIPYTRLLTKQGAIRSRGQIRIKRTDLLAHLEKHTFIGGELEEDE